MKWPIVSLGDVCDFVMGQAPPGRTCNQVGEGTPFVKAGEFSDRLPVIREWTTKPLRMAMNGDVLVCVVGATAGKVNQGIDCAIGRSVAAVRPRNGTIDSGFTYHFLRGRVRYLRAQSQGLAQGVITREMLSALKLALPPLVEQRRIASVLDHAADLQSRRRSAIRLMDRLVQAEFLQMFKDDIASSTCSFASVVDEFRYGTSMKATASGDPVLRIPNVVGGALNLNEVKYVQLSDAEFRRLRLLDGDLLFVRTNGNREYTGRCAMFSSEQLRAAGHSFDRCVYASYLIRARLTDVVIPQFIVTYMNGPGRPLLNRNAKTSAGQFNINIQGLGNVSVPIPTLERQKDFVTRLEGIHRMRQRYVAGSDRLDELFTSLMSRAFSGQL